MPQYPALTEDQFNQVADRVVANAPEGLDEAAFNALLDEEVAKAEAFQAMVASGQQNLSRDLSMAAGLATGPGVIAPALAAGGAYFLGERLQGKDRGEAAQAGLREGAMSAALGTGLKAIAGPIRRLADYSSRRLMKGAIKPDRGYLERMAGASHEGIAEMEDRIARTALDRGLNPLTHQGANTLQSQIDDVAGARQAKIEAAPDVPVRHSGAAVTRSLNRELARQTRQTASADDAAAVRSVMRDAAANPLYGADDAGHLQDLTPRQLAAVVEGDNRALAKTFGERKSAGVEAVKGVRRTRAKMLDRAAGTRQEGQQLRDLIDLRNVSNIARRRGEARDLVGITDIISLSAGRPLVLGATTAMRPAAQAGIAGGLHRASRGMAGAESAELREAIRALLGQALSVSHDGQE